jgi:UrcA family protein
MNSSKAFSSPRSLITAAVFGVLAASFGAAFAAGTSSDPVSVNVRYSDLNVSRPRDALVLYNRIQRAAENACSYWWFKSDADESRCVHDAIANTVTKVNHPALFAVYNSKNKAPLPGTLVSQSR